jgi:hypothetical protein
VAGPASIPVTVRSHRVAAMDAASGTGMTRSITVGRKPGSVRGRPMPGMREGIPVA